MVVQFAELFLDRHPREIAESPPEPMCRSCRTESFATAVVSGPIGQRVRPPRGRDLGDTVERRQCRQRTIEAVISAPVPRRSAVVDRPAIGVCSWVSSDRESVAIAELVFDPTLVCRLLDGLETTRGHDPAVGRVGESSGRVGPGDVVADRSEVVGAQRRVRGASR